MKKILALMMCFGLLCGCSTDNASDLDDNTKNDTTNDTSDVTDNKDNTTTNSWYDRFEGELKGGNVAYTSKDKLDATAIGGVEGYRYVTENGNIDVYRFEDGDEYNKIMQEKKIRVNDKDYAVEVKDNMVIVADKLSDDVKNIFHGMK